MHQQAHQILGLVVGQICKHRHPSSCSFAAAIFANESRPLRVSRTLAERRSSLVHRARHQAVLDQPRYDAR